MCMLVLRVPDNKLDFSREIPISSEEYLLPKHQRANQISLKIYCTDKNRDTGRTKSNVHQ